MTDIAILPSRTLSGPLFAEPRFATVGLFVAASLAATLAALQIDPRLFQGESIWLKPVKFQVALTVYLLTLAVFARWMPAATLASRRWRTYAWVVVFAVFAELAWIGGAAMYGTASHFNVATPVMNALYNLMGAAAVTLTSATLVMGIAIWRNPATGLDPAVRLALALGLVLTFVLTVPVAGYMASTPGHLVGTPVLDARVPLMGWSREVGDLRVAHFFATHALHFVPLAGLAALALPERHRRAAVIAAAVAFSALVAALFVQSLAGLPVLPLA